MKTFTTTYRQGELRGRRIDQLPEGVIRVPAIDGKVIVGHSETGHHHVMDDDRTEMYRLPDSIYDCFLVVREPDALRHLKSYDTHESIMHQPGIYHVRCKREWTPEGLRPVVD